MRVLAQIDRCRLQCPPESQCFVCEGGRQVCGAQNCPAPTATPTPTPLPDPLPADLSCTYSNPLVATDSSFFQFQTASCSSQYGALTSVAMQGFSYFIFISLGIIVFVQSVMLGTWFFKR